MDCGPLYETTVQGTGYSKSDEYDLQLSDDLTGILSGETCNLNVIWRNSV